jgi:hypothetical protein
MRTLSKKEELVERPTTEFDPYWHVIPYSAKCQARVLYSWEETALPDSSGGGYLSLPECQEYINMIWQDFGLVNPPKVGDGRGTLSARTNGTTIMLPKWARNYAILTHELSHCITRLFDPVDDLNHGGAYLHVYFTLLTRYGDYKYSKLVQLAIAGGLLVTKVCIKTRIAHLITG